MIKVKNRTCDIRTQQAIILHIIEPPHDPDVGANWKAKYRSSSEKRMGESESMLTILTPSHLFDILLRYRRCKQVGTPGMAHLRFYRTWFLAGLVPKKTYFEPSSHWPRAILRRNVLGDRHVRSASDSEGVVVKMSMDEDSASAMHGLE
jgi:hypothetical protein